ncbi:MAG TPA: serine/threonine-protein kinase, partial [Isosphaeraceae bacterium]|nr:serine/threonine-protein kinase [Isosphaeraceae bacterium]
MPVNPKHVQAVFVAAVEHEDPTKRAAVLDRLCSANAELRQHVEALLRAHDQPEGRVYQTIVEPAGLGIAPRARVKHDGLERTEDEPAIGASEGSGPTIGSGPDASSTSGGGASPETTTRAVPFVSGYEIMGELGRGGMGVVYRARQVRLNRPCALKMILAGAHSNADAAVRFLAEAEAVARLQHPNVVQIHHVGEANGLPYFELEYLDGGSLDQHLDGTPWPAKRAATLIEALARGVAEAHRLGIVHRDLKPANVLLAADGTPKVTDFGLAKLLGTDSGLTATDSIMGSPSYMAPEQASGLTRQIGPQCDIYALGATLYDLLTGRPPFRGATVIETLEQ